MERKRTYRECHVQDNADIAAKKVKIYLNTKKFPALSFCAPNSKPHGPRGLNKHYHLLFDPKLGNGVCAICCITCACVACTSMLDKPCISGIPSDEQEHYLTVTNCTYCPVPGSLKNWNIIQLSQKSTPYYAFDEIQQVVLDGISDNMDSLVQSGKYSSMNTTGTAKNGFYVIMFTPEAYTLQDNTKIDRKIITFEKLVVKAQYLCSIQESTNWFWDQHP